MYCKSCVPLYNDGKNGLWWTNVICRFRPLILFMGHYSWHSSSLQLLPLHDNICCKLKKNYNYHVRDTDLPLFFGLVIIGNISIHVREACGELHMSAKLCHCDLMYWTRNKPLVKVDKWWVFVSKEFRLCDLRLQLNMIMFR